MALQSANNFGNVNDSAKEQLQYAPHPASGQRILLRVLRDNDRRLLLCLLLELLLIRRVDELVGERRLVAAETQTNLRRNTDSGKAKNDIQKMFFAM